MTSSNLAVPGIWTLTEHRRRPGFVHHSGLCPGSVWLTLSGIHASIKMEHDVRKVRIDPQALKEVRSLLNREPRTCRCQDKMTAVNLVSGKKWLTYILELRSSSGITSDEMHFEWKCRTSFIKLYYTRPFRRLKLQQTRLSTHKECVTRKQIKGRGDYREPTLARQVGKVHEGRWFVKEVKKSYTFDLPGK
jgi:hypothetical protein